MSYILLHRQLRDHWLWSDRPFSKGQAWIDLLMLACWKDEKALVKGSLIEKKRGEVHASIKWLADRWGWGWRKVSRFLEMLANDKMVTLNSTTHGTTVTIENYSKFQDCWRADSTTDSTSDSTPDSTTDSTQRKKIQRSNNTIQKKNKGIPPTLEEVKAYCIERGNSVDPEAFIAFYESNGWKVGKNPMKDWKAAVRTWEKRELKRTERKLSPNERAYMEIERRRAHGNSIDLE